MGCNNSKQPTEEIDDEPEVENVPQTRNKETTEQSLKNPSGKIFRSLKGVSFAIIAAKRAKLRPLPPQIAQSFSEQHTNDLSLIFAQHAQQSSLSLDHDQDDDDEDINSSMTLSVIALSKALSLPYQHIHPTDTNTTATNPTPTHHSSDLFARQLHRCFANESGTIEFRDFMQHVATLKTAGNPLLLTEYIYNLFNVSQQEDGILLSDMIDMTVSLLHMACNDDAFAAELDSLGLDWVHCAVVHEDTIRTVVKEVIKETFIESAVTQKKHVTKVDFQNWMQGLMNLKGNNIFNKAVVENDIEESNDETSAILPPRLNRQIPATTDDTNGNNENENESGSGSNPIDRIDWNEQDEDEDEGEVKDEGEIHQSQGGTGYI